MPSAGLVDKPQDTKFYDWNLVDPKDKPYAAFLFHYRSWEYLQSLQLIPALHPRILLKPSNSFALLAGCTGIDTIRNGRDMNEWDVTSDFDLLNAPQDCPPRELSTSILFNSSACDEMESMPKYDNQQVEFMASDSPSKAQRHNQVGLSLSDSSVCRTPLDKWFYERPLPKIPKAKPLLDHSQRLSTSSNAPSITPSLSSWFERDLNDPSPKPVIEIAAAVPLLRTTSQITTSTPSGSLSVLGMDGNAQESSS